MAHSVRYLDNHSSPLLSVPKPDQELLKSIRLILERFSPTRPWKNEDCPPKGLLTGPTSLAYLFLQLSRTHPELTIKDRTAKDWCLAYLDCGQSEIPLDVSGKLRVGITNEYLAYNAVLAAATGDPKAIQNLVNGGADPRADPNVCEYLYGYAGLLAFLRIVRTFVPESKDVMDKAMEAAIETILAHRPWSFHGHEYLGAGHGTVGIIAQVVLCAPRYAEHPAIIESLERLLQLQQDNGNWLPAPEQGSGLVQWCHGAPGMILSLLPIRQYFPAELRVRIDDAVARGRKATWERGLLTKEPNLCHGITGNALALEGEQREHFMAHATAEKIEAGLREGVFVKGSDLWGLMWGEGSRAWGWMALNKGLDLGYPAYSDL